VRKTPALTLAKVLMEASFRHRGLMMNRLHPWYVTGLVEGEGTFSVSFNFRKRLKIGIETRPSFSLSQNEANLELLKEVRRFFRCGAIRYSRSDRTYKYEVRSVRDIVTKILPHFREYPLRGAKASDFEKFADICKMVHANLHRNARYLREIIELAYLMNPSGKRKHRKEELLRALGEVKV
jgi:hypothetical protein